MRRARNHVVHLVAWGLTGHGRLQCAVVHVVINHGTPASLFTATPVPIVDVVTRTCEHGAPLVLCDRSRHAFELVLGSVWVHPQFREEAVEPYRLRRVGAYIILTCGNSGT